MGSARESALADCSNFQSWCRKYDTRQAGGYARLTATASSLQYDHVQNSNAQVIDSFTITKGPVPPTPPTPPSPPPPTPEPTPVPAPTPTPGSKDTLEAGETLKSGDNLESLGGKAYLYLQGTDGNLVLRNAAHK